MKGAERQQKYIIHDTFLLRSPVLALEVLKKISESENIEEILIEFYSRKDCQESIFLASTGLYRHLISWLNGQDTLEKVKRKLLQYLIRMSSRCTPFGSFAGVCTGHFGKDEKVQLSSTEDHSLSFRPDMQLLCLLVSKMLEDRDFRRSLKYAPNSSIYCIGEEYRYIEHYHDTEGSRKYMLNACNKQTVLDEILNASSGSLGFQEIYTLVRDAAMDPEEVQEYIHALIDNQVLIPNLEPSVSGKGFFTDLEATLCRNKRSNAFTSLFSEICRGIHSLNSDKGLDRVEVIDSLSMKAKESGLEFSENAFIQADMKLGVQDCQLSRQLKADLLEAINILIRLSKSERNPLLERFKEKFINRYGEREMQLSILMDAEIGPAYLPDDGGSGNSPLLDGLQLPFKESLIKDIEWSVVDSLLNEKHQMALMSGQYKLELTASDLEGLAPPEHDLPRTISMLVNILGKYEKDPRKRILHIRTAGGNSAINLAGRFAYLENDLDDCLKEIAGIEEDIYGDTMLAEIVHLPEERTGNVLLRPVMHTYEIPYLAKATVGEEFRLPVDDLMVRVKDNKVLLRSKKLDRLIVPRLSNAHNYSLGQLSMYRFLCDLQSQDITTGLSFSWGPLEDEAIFLPRVCCKNVVLKAAQWKLPVEQLNALKGAEGIEKFAEMLNDLRSSLRIPKEILLVDFDNELWLDLDSEACLHIMYHEIRKRNDLTIREFLQPGEDALVKSYGGNQSNEFLFFLYQEH